MEDAVTAKFDVSRYLMKIRTREGLQDYLKVHGRILALHNAYPAGRFEITVSAIELTETRAVFHARVTLPNGVVAENVGSETKSDFADFVEKAATKAIGRALANAGFGTEYALLDYDLGEGEERPDNPMPRVVDSPAPRATPQPTARPAADGESPERPANLATGKQIGYARTCARERGLSEGDLLVWARRTHGVNTLWDLTRQQASALIDLLRAGDPTIFPEEKDEETFPA